MLLYTVQAPKEAMLAGTSSLSEISLAQGTSMMAALGSNGSNTTGF